MTDLKQKLINAYIEISNIPYVDIDAQVRELMKNARLRGIHNQVAEYLMEAVGDDGITRLSMQCSIDRALQEPLGIIQFGLIPPVLKTVKE